VILLSAGNSSALRKTLALLLRGTWQAQTFPSRHSKFTDTKVAITLMDRNTHRGFTLIELVIAMAIAGILLGIGVPSFIEAIRSSRMSTQYNELVGALYLARSEAIKGSDNVTVCARKSDTQCGDDWNNGLLVFADTADFDDANAQPDSIASVLRIVEPLGNDAAGMTKRDFIRYGSEGSANWATGTIQLCDGEKKQERSRALNVVLTGDLRPGRPSSTTSKVPMDVFNTAIECK